MKPADTTTIANLPGPPSDLLADLLTNPPGDVEADAEARKVHAADAAKAWRWILIRLRPEMSDDEVRGLVLSVLQEKQPQLAVEAGVVGRLTAAALRQHHSGSQPPPKPGPKPNPKPGISQRALSSIARIPAKQIGMAGLAFVALMLIIDPMMTAFVVAVTAPFVAMFAILRAFRGGAFGRLLRRKLRSLSSRRKRRDQGTPDTGAGDRISERVGKSSACQPLDMWKG